MTATPRHLPRRTLATTVLVAGAGTFLFAAPGTALAGEGPTSASAGDAEKSIVHVGVEWKGFVQYPTRNGHWRWSDPIEVTTSCTGWFASEQGHVVTAGHCVDPAEAETAVLETFLAQQGLGLDPSRLDWRVEGSGANADPDRTAVWAVQPSAVEGAVIEDPLIAQVVDWQPFENGDLALLKVNNLSEPSPALTVSADRPSVGDEVTAIGYPDTISSISDAARLRASFKSGTVSSTQVTHAGVARTEVNADLAPGMSGGPTVDDDGAVLGVNSSASSGQSFNFITDHAALVAFLDHHDVEASAAGSHALTAGTGLPVPASSSQTSDLPTTTLLAATGGALAVAAGGTFLFGRRRPVAASASGAAGRAEATRFVGRPAWVAPNGTRGPACSHAGSAPGSGYCRDCGTRLTRRG